MKTYFLAILVLAMVGLSAQGAKGGPAPMPAPAPKVPPADLRPLYVPQPPTDALTACGGGQEIQHLEYWPVEGDRVFVAQFLASGGGTVTLNVEGQSATAKIADTPNLQPYTLTVEQTVFPGYRPAVIWFEAEAGACPSDGQRVTAINLHVGD